MLGLTSVALLLLTAAPPSLHRLPSGVSPLPVECIPGAAVSLRIAATTDVHGHVMGWDYYDNRADPLRGLTRAATIVDSLRAANPGRVLLVDAGDMLQGTPLTYVAARVSKSRINPVVAAMNAMRYDAATVGNHEFNYGVPYLDSAVAQARFPLLAANVTRHGSLPGYGPFTIVHRDGVAVGIVGATTPGSNLWDASNLSQAGVRVGDIVPAVRASVAEARRRGADVIVVVLHSGLNEPSSYDTVATRLPGENVSARVAAEIPGINVLVYGHSHRENSGQLIGGTLVVQPKNWATSVAVVSMPVACSAARRWVASTATSTVIQSVGHPEQDTVKAAVAQLHNETLTYVNSAIGTTPDAWRSDSARLAPTGLTGLIMEVERRAAHADIASTAAFDLHAHLGPGPITVAQLAQLYPYENTLRAIRITGSQLKAYLEYSNRYYETNAAGELVPDTSVAGYNFDVVSGVHYTVDVTKPLGQRVLTLTFRDRAVAPTDTFIMALNNYRQSGGGGYAMLRNAPVVYDKQQDIRQLLIEEVQRLHEIHEVDYRTNNWSFVKPSAAR